MELALADAMGGVVAVYSPDKPWAQMVRDAARAFLELLASRPTFARMAMIEAPSTGGRAFELYASGRRVLPPCSNGAATTRWRKRRSPPAPLALRSPPPSR